MKSNPRPDGSKIRDLRWERRLPTRELASKAGITPQYLNRIMCGTRGASLRVQKALAAALSVPVEEIQK